MIGQIARVLRRNVRWQIVALMVLGTVINYIARNSLGQLAPELQAKLHITTAQYSYVVGAFQLSYTLMLPICGLLVDRIGLRFGFAIFAAIWSVANMLHAFAFGWLSLAFFRGILGASEAVVIPAGVKTSTEWFPITERSQAIGWINVGTALGAVLAGPVAIGLALLAGWRAAFMGTGVLGLAWAAAWYWFYRAPAAHAALTDDERAYIEQGQPKRPARPHHNLADIVRLLTTRKFWVIAIPRFLAEPAWQTFIFWIPLYLARNQGMDLKHIALFGWLPFLAADVGGIAGGYLSPIVARHFRVELIPSRIIVIFGAAVLMIAPGCIGLVSSPAAAITLLAIGGFAHQTLSVLINTLTADCYPSEEVGMANGFVSQAGWVGGLLFSLLIGQLADTIGFAPLFGALGVFDLIGALILILAIKQLVPYGEEAKA